MTMQVRPLVMALMLIVAGFLGGAAFRWFDARDGTSLPDAGTPVSAVPLDRLSLSPLVQRVSPGVVNIAVLQPSPLEQNPLLRDPWFQDFMGVPAQALAPRISAGSGFVVDAARGLVLTNHHVIDNARAIEVTVGERRMAAELIGTHPPSDIAVLRIPPRGLTQLPLGDSNQLAVGDYVVAIGNPFEIGQTVTSGIVSALGRGRRGGGPSYVQTDAAINPGNSGGPLLNMRGEVIGINTAILSPGQGNVGIGLAVPSNQARQVMEAIVRQSGLR
ncbi:trypsin-like peptidase domain-containing protein [Sphingosinicella terrae]|uniref:trypsin-like peptidase domain-containing protein n=1 Tax=Sphingosinicella terrae TaxID=2172047 RepID=UPI0025486CCC|nr:trypsin-like peptidase domain-containing protein [Sphingosinicella terrae]